LFSFIYLLFYITFFVLFTKHAFCTNFVTRTAEYFLIAAAKNTFVQRS